MVVAGSLALDSSCTYVPSPFSNPFVPQLQTSNAACIEQHVGGVGHNVSTALHYLGVRTKLCTHIGDDLAGRTALSSLDARGLSTSGVRTIHSRAHTAQFVAVNDANNNLLMAMADMSIFEEDQENFEQGWGPYIAEQQASWFVVDGNWQPRRLRQWIQAGQQMGAKVAFEPVSVEKAKRLFANPVGDVLSTSTFPNPLVDLATPNVLELHSMFEAASSNGYLDGKDRFQVIDSFGMSSSGSREKLTAITSATMVDRGIPQQCIQLLPYVPCLVTTLGPDGVVVTELIRRYDDRLASPDFAANILTRSTDLETEVGGIYMRHFPSVEEVPAADIVSVNGVGDTFLGAVIAGLIKGGSRHVSDLVNFGQKCSVETLKSTESVSPAISRVEIPA